MSKLFDLTGKTAIVTGATKGIGQAIAVGLAEAGADIVSLQRNTTDDSTSKQIQQLGRKCIIVTCDLFSRDSLVNAVKEALSKTTIDIVINCAGTQRRFPAEVMSMEAFDDVIQCNLTAIFTICKNIGAHWLENKQKGVIINVASLAAFQGGLNMSAYSASKGGVLMYTRALSNEWAGRGIRVNCIAPGYIATDINKDTRTDPDKRANFEFINSRIPMGRWGEPEEFKGVAIFLASEASAYISGECLTVDGGWMAR